MERTTCCRGSTHHSGSLCGACSRSSTAAGKSTAGTKEKHSEKGAKRSDHMVSFCSESLALCCKREQNPV